MMTSFTVVIPTLGNRATFLAEALSSVVSQSRVPDRIVIVNNGPADIDAAPLLEIARSIPLRVIRTVHRAGAAQARNLGASVATTSHVSFLDDDDLWDPDYLSHVEQAISTGAPACVLGRLQSLSARGINELKNPVDQIDLAGFLVRNPGATGSNTSVERETFLSLGGYDPYLTMGQDKALIVDFLTAGVDVTAVPQAIAIQRVHGGDRATDADRAVIGLSRFYTKYSTVMTPSQRLENQYKIARERYIAKPRPANLLVLAAARIVVTTLHLTERLSRQRRASSS